MCVFKKEPDKQAPNEIPDNPADLPPVKEPPPQM
jgi:hypothetical protein